MTEGKVVDRVDTLRATGLDLVRALEEAGALTPVSLTLADPDIPYDQYEALAAMFGSVKLSCSWWIGDLLNWGEKVFGETYAQAAELTGLTVETLRSYCYVCRAVAKRRRRASLSFGHHRLVAPLDPDDQTRWLDEAEKNAWARSAMEAAMRAAQEAPKPPEEPAWTTPAPEAPMPAQGLWARLRPTTNVTSGNVEGTMTLTVNGEPFRAEILQAPTAICDAVRAVLELAEPLDDDFDRVPRSALAELAALVAAE